MTKFEKFHPLAERDEQTAINLLRDAFTAVHPVQPEEDADVTAVHPIQPEENADVTAVHPIQPEEDADVIAVHPVQPEEDALEVRPFPLDLADASDVTCDAVEVRPFPLNPVDASDDTSDAVEVRPSPLGSIESSDETDDLVAVQPLPLGPVFASSEDETALEPAFEASFASSATSSFALATASVSQTSASSYLDTNTSLNAIKNSYSGTLDEWQALYDDGKITYSYSTWQTLGDLDIRDFVAKDMTTGPTLAGTNWDAADKDAADFVVKGSGTKLATWGSNAGATTHYLRENVLSSGLERLSTDDLLYNKYTDSYTYNMGTSGNLYKAKYNTWYTDYDVRTGVDASAVEGYVTYNGFDKDYWGTYYVKGNGNTANHGVEYEYNNVFKGSDYGNTITGGQYGDVLIGGQSADMIYGVGGENLIYGVGGDNRIDGGSGDSTIFGGTGNDFIISGEGSNNIVLADGNNWVVLNQTELVSSEEGDPAPNNTVVLGTGTDTVVIGNIPASETTTTTTMGGWGAGLATDVGLDVGTDAVSAMSDFMGATNPIWGMAFSASKDLLSALIGGTPKEIVETTEYATPEVTQIIDFNPVTDRLLMPMNSSGTLNIQIESNVTSGYDLTIKELVTIDGRNVLSPIAYVNFTSKENIFYPGSEGAMTSYTELTTAEKQAFADALMANSMVVDESGIQVGTSENGVFNVSSGDMDALTSVSDDLGAGRYMFAGAWGGNYVFGGNGNIYGTQHDDVLFGFDLYADTIEADSQSGHTFYGFGGDNLYAPGSGVNRVHGADGEDTVSYEWSYNAIDVDMSAKVIDENNEKFGLGVYVYNGFGSVEDNYDYLWNVENIIGSNHDDVIIGDENDNTLISTGGANTWTGTGGANSFVLTGGSSTITDFTDGSDTILIHKLAYVDASVNFRANMTWVESEDDWTLYDMTGDDAQALVILEKGDGFDGPVDIDLYRPNGEIDTITANTITSHNLGIDLVA